MERLNDNQKRDSFVRQPGECSYGVKNIIYNKIDLPPSHIYLLFQLECYWWTIAPLLMLIPVNTYTRPWWISSL